MRVTIAFVVSGAFFTGCVGANEPDEASAAGVAAAQVAAPSTVIREDDCAGPFPNDPTGLVGDELIEDVLKPAGQ